MKRCRYISFLLLFAAATAAAQDPKKDSIKKEEDKKIKLPLKVGRKIPIKTSEGTWMSLDVSPDGKTLAFDLLGDIFTMPIPG